MAISKSKNIKNNRKRKARNLKRFNSYFLGGQPNEIVMSVGIEVKQQLEEIFK